MKKATHPSKRKTAVIVVWAVLLAWMVFIFSMSAQNAERSEMTSGGVIETLLKTFYRGFDKLDDPARADLIEQYQFIVRKTAHFTAYAALGVLAYVAFNVTFTPPGMQYFWWNTALAALFAVIYAASDEIHQHFVPGRSCALKDVLIDSSGAATGILAALAVTFVIGRAKKRRCIFNVSL